MPLDNLQPLVNLAGNENIAISVLASMLYICIGAIVGLCGFIVLIIRWFLAREKEAWQYVGKHAEALKATEKNIAIIADRAERQGRR
jgi:hypothetical protein